MKKIKKHYIISIPAFFFLGVLVAGILLYIVHSNKKSVIPKTVNVFGAPRVQAQQTFPSSNPQFTATIGYIKPTSLHQQSITVYQLKDAKKIPVFERTFYADGFRGNTLTYTIASSSAEIIQSGSLGTIGCTANDCTKPWSNFYTWDKKQGMFVLENTEHEDAFQQLFLHYQAMDQKGCSVMKGSTITGQQDLSFTQLYKKYPTATYYCSQSQGILPANLMFFLQTEEILKEIVHGENEGSDDIRDVTL
jgi:hypothetical protein